MSDPALTRRFRRLRFWLAAGMWACIALFFGTLVLVKSTGWDLGRVGLTIGMVAFLLALVFVLTLGTFGSLCPRCRRWLLTAKAVREAPRSRSLTDVLKACPSCKQQL